MLRDEIEKTMMKMKGKKEVIKKKIG